LALPFLLQIIYDSTILSIVPNTQFCVYVNLMCVCSQNCTAINNLHKKDCTGNKKNMAISNGSAIQGNKDDPMLYFLSMLRK
jgi:hypothetical protein